MWRRKRGIAVLHALADAAVKEKQIKLQVANARAEESGGGIARIPRAAMAELGLAEGDVVQIGGKRQTASRVVAPYAEDEGLEVIRLDGLQRANAGAGAGDMVVLNRVETRPATRVVFAPAQENLRLQGSAIALKRRFFGRPLVAGDTVATAGQQRLPSGEAAPDLNAPAYALADPDGSIRRTYSQDGRAEMALGGTKVRRRPRDSAKRPFNFGTG